MDTFDDIEDSIRRHEEQLDENKRKNKQEDTRKGGAGTEPSQPYSLPPYVSLSSSATMLTATMPAVMRPTPMTTAGKFCLITLATILLVQVASALGVFALMVGATVFLAMRFVFGVVIIGSSVWMIFQLINNP